MRGKLPVIEKGFTWPTISSVALHKTWKPLESRLQATPELASSKVRVRLQKRSKGTIISYRKSIKKKKTNREMENKSSCC